MGNFLKTIAEHKGEFITVKLNAYYNEDCDLIDDYDEELKAATAEDLRCCRLIAFDCEAIVTLNCNGAQLASEWICRNIYHELVDIMPDYGADITKQAVECAINTDWNIYAAHIKHGALAELQNFKIESLEVNNG